MSHRRIILCGAAGRDFHDFITVFRDDPDQEVVAFTATQIPGIEDRRLPPSLSGPRYPDGVPIHPEEELEALIAQHSVDDVVMSYSDVSYAQIGGLAARALAAGADFRLLAPDRTMLAAPCPVVAVTAVRTGCGKSQVTRHVALALRDAGHRVVVVRHPMPYGDLAAQAVQRFAELEDMTRHNCTFEEREEYEAHVALGLVVYAGVDYPAILARAAAEADVILWDGGNNDTPFFRPDLWITLVDPLRPGHETAYHPGAVNLRRAHAVVVNKVDSARPQDVEAVLAAARAAAPSASVHLTESRVSVPDPAAVRGRRVLCIDDGPTLTHGGMAWGAARVAADRFGAAEVVDPRPFARGSLREVLDSYPHIDRQLPAMGYFPAQIADLEASIAAAAAHCDLVLVGTPFDLARHLELPIPAVRVEYNVVERPGAGPTLVSLARSVFG